MKPNVLVFILIQYLLIFVFIFSASFAFAGNGHTVTNETILISGKVIDKISGEEIVGAEVKVDDKIVYTDLNGNFSANINVKHTEAIIKYVSYTDTKVTIDPFKYNTIVIELASR